MGQSAAWNGSGRGCTGRLIRSGVALLHHFIHSKTNVLKPVSITELPVWLLLWRALPMAWPQPLTVYPSLEMAAGLGAAGIAFAWRAITTQIDTWHVLFATETLRFGL
jgi:hypothetical protein